jgi:hypothetical protein
MRLTFYGIAFILFGLAARPAAGQLSSERLAWNNLNKARWTKVEGYVRKALKKDSLNVPAHYVHSWYFFTEGNPRFSVDSAHKHVQKAIRIFSSFSLREKERWARFPVDSTLLYKLKGYIDSAAFERAKLESTEKSYQYFIDNFVNSRYKSHAIVLLHEVAFGDALKTGTYEAFYVYWKRYPESKRAEEARFRYEKLLFESITKDKRLEQFDAFVKEYPSSPYRLQAEREIFEITTATGQEKDFMRFIQQYPQSSFIKIAKDLLYHIHKEQDETAGIDLLSDSAQRIAFMEASHWIPIWKNGHYSFMDSQGNEYLMNVSDTLDQSVICKGLTEDFLLANNKLISKSGKVLHERVNFVENLGYGFLKLQSDRIVKILHRSGFISASTDGDAELIGHHFIWIKTITGQSLHTLTGRKLMDGKWDQVASFGDCIGFKTKRGWQLTTVTSIGGLANNIPLASGELVDSVRLMNKKNLLVQKGHQQSLLAPNLETIIPFGDHIIHFENDLFIIRDQQGLQIFHKKTTNRFFMSLEIVNNQIIAKEKDGFLIGHLKDADIDLHEKVYDSVYITGPLIVALKNDSTTIFFQQEKRSYKDIDRVTTISNIDNHFIILHNEHIKTVISSTGKFMFSASCDKISYAGTGLFEVHKKNKKTIVDLKGKPLNITDYDALGNASGNSIALLSKKRFGLINSSNKKIVKPAYERTPSPYNKELIVVFKDKKYSFIDWEGNNTNGIEFDEVLHWNDSVALVKYNLFWRLFDCQSNQLKPGKITNYSIFVNNEAEKLALFKQDNSYGVMSSKNGVILEPSFSNITVLGTQDNPVYLTEKYIEEADIYIIIYYNSTGELLRKQVLEPHDYKKIKCPSPVKN